MNWYEENIEEPVREVVKLLRENGINTVCSCGHKMYVECNFIDVLDAERVWHLLVNNGYKGFKIELFYESVDTGCCWHMNSGLRIDFKARS